MIRKFLAGLLSLVFVLSVFPSYALGYQADEQPNKLTIEETVAVLEAELNEMGTSVPKELKELRASYQTQLLEETDPECIQNLKLLINTCSKLEGKKQEHARVSQLKMELYPNWKSGILSKSEYLSLKEKFDHQLEQIEHAIAKIEEEIRQYHDTANVDNQFIKHFLKYRNITEPTREVIVELIEMIYVHEGGTITIEFKFQDEYQRLLDLLAEHNAASQAS